LFQRLKSCVFFVHASWAAKNNISSNIIVPSQ
jgi:hypothetical protein